MKNQPVMSPKDGQSVVRIALNEKGWMRNPSVVANLPESEIASRIQVIMVPTPDIFEGDRFYVATDPSEKPGAASLVILVSSNNEAQAISSREHFLRFTNENEHTVSSSTTAWEFVRLYVRLFGYPYPQYWDAIHFLETADQIRLKPGETLPDSIRRLIQPMKHRKTQNGFFIQFLAWTELGGQLKRFEISISNSGSLAAKEEELAANLGQSWLPK